MTRPTAHGGSVTALRANEKRSQLVQQQAQAPMLARMRAMDRAHRAAGNAVEVQVRALRSAVGLPPGDQLDRPVHSGGAVGDPRRRIFGPA